jgi:hypothetical protein
MQLIPFQPAPVPLQETAAPELAKKPMPETAQAVPPAAPPPTPPLSAAIPGKPLVRPVPILDQKTKEAAPPVRTSKMTMVLSAVLIISLAGYGIVTYINSPSRKAQEARKFSSIEDLHITNITGSLEANGDLLITGVVENTANQDKRGWYVVAEVYNAEGKVLNKIRLVNGKQLYTRSDYEILAQRGINIEDLKTRRLLEQDVLLPAKGSTTFEMHYLLPPSGIASFNATMQPFDPARPFAERDEHVK